MASSPWYSNHGSTTNQTTSRSPHPTIIQAPTSTTSARALPRATSRPHLHSRTLPRTLHATRHTQRALDISCKDGPPHHRKRVPARLLLRWWAFLPACLQTASTIGRFLYDLAHAIIGGLNSLSSRALLFRYPYALGAAAPFFVPALARSSPRLLRSPSLQLYPQHPLATSFDTYAPPITQ